MNEQLEKYYEYLKGAGADVPDTFDSFNSTLSDEANRQQYYDYLKGEGYDTPETYESFSNTLFGVTPTDPVKKKDDTQVLADSSPESLDVSPEKAPEAAGPIAPQQPWDKVLEGAGIQKPVEQPSWDSVTPAGSLTEGMDVPDVNMEDVGKVESGPIGPDNPYRPDLKGFVLAENQIKSRLRNDKIKPWMFSGQNDPGSDVTPSGKPAYEGTTELELPKDLSWEDLAEQVEKGEGTDIAAGLDKYLNYEGRQILDHVLKKRYEDQLRARYMLIDPDDPILLDIEGNENDEGVELYDMNTFGMTKVTKDDIKNYLDSSAKRLFGEESINDLPEDQQKYLVEQFANKYSDRETVESMFKESGMDFDVSRLQHIYSAFVKGGYGMLEGSAKGTTRLLDSYINSLNEMFPGNEEIHPLGEQRYWEDKNIGYDKDFNALEKKQLGVIGAYKQNPKYQNSFLSNTLPSALGSALGIVGGGGGTPLGMGIVGSTAGGDMQATSAFQKGADPDAAFKAQIAGMGIGATEALPFMNIFNRFSPGVKGSILQRIAISSGEEGLQEIFAGALNNLTAQQLYDEQQRIIDDKTLEEGAAGAIIGALFAGGAAMANRRQKNDQPDIPTNEENQAKLKKLYDQANKQQETELVQEPETPGTPEVETGKKAGSAKIPVSVFAKGDGGTKGVFEDESGNLYKSSQKMKRTVKKNEDGSYRVVNEEIEGEGSITEEHEILSENSDLTHIPKVGDKVNTSEGEAFQIEKLEEVEPGSLTIEEANQIQETLDELQKRGVQYGDKIKVMRRPGTGEVVLTDLSNSWKPGSRVEETSISKDKDFKEMLSPSARNEVQAREDSRRGKLIGSIAKDDNAKPAYLMTQRPPAPGTFPVEGRTDKDIEEVEIKSGSKKGRKAYRVEYSEPLSEKEQAKYELTKVYDESDVGEAYSSEFAGEKEFKVITNVDPEGMTIEVTTYKDGKSSSENIPFTYAKAEFEGMTKENFTENTTENARLPEEQATKEETIETETETNIEAEAVADAPPKFDLNEGESLSELGSRKKTKTATRQRIKKLKKDHAVFQTKQHTIVRDRDGLHVIRNKENLPEDRSKKVHREVVKQYIAENFNSMEDADAIVEAAMVWDANRPLRKGKGRADMGVDDIIASEIGGMSRADFARYGDPNAITDQMAKAYGMDERKGGIDVDVAVASASNFGGREDAITPEDVVDFMTRFPGGPKDFRAHAKKASIEAGFEIDLDERDRAAARFRELTGLDIGESVANQIFTEDAKRMQLDPVEEARNQASKELNAEAEKRSIEADLAERSEVKQAEATTDKKGDPNARKYKAPDGATKKARTRERQYLNRTLEDEMTPQKVKDRLSGEPREYTQQENSETREIALQAIASFLRNGLTYSEIFDIVATDAVLPNALDRFAIAKIVSHKVQNTDPDLTAAIDIWLDHKSRDYGRAIQILDAIMPESRVRRQRRDVLKAQQTALEKRGQSGKTIDAELTEVKQQVENGKKDVEQAFEAIQTQIPGIGDPQIIADPGAQKRVSKSNERKKKIKEGKSKVKEGLALLKKLPPTANASFVGMTPDQVKGLRLIGQGLIEQGYYRFAEWRARFVAALQGYSIDADRVALEVWNDSSLGERNLSSEAMDQRREEAINELSNKIVDRAKDKQPKQRDLLDMVVSELYAKAAEVIPKESQKKQSPSEVVAEMIQNRSLSEEVWSEARDRVKAKIEENPKYTDEQRADMNARLDDYFTLVSDVPFGHTRARQAIREGAREIGAEIKEIAIQHYTKAEASRQSLAEKLVARVGLTGSDAKALEQAFADELRAMNAEQQRKILERQLGPAKTPKQKRRNKRIVERAVDQINMGALSDSRFKGLFGEKYGFPEINPEVESQLTEIVRLINLVEGGEYKRRKMAEFTDLLDRLDNQHTSYYTMRALTEHFYVSILSGVTTLFRAGVGASMTQTANVAANTVAHMTRDIANGRSPFTILSRGVRAYWKGAMKGAPIYRGILRTGYSELESTGDQGNYSPLREVINTPFSETIKKIKEAKGNKKKSKAVGNLVYKSLFQPMTMVFRNLIALDAIFHYGQKEYFTMVEEHNKLLSEGTFDKRDQAFWSEIHKRMADGKNFTDQAEIQVDEEIAILKQAGQKVPKEYRKKRVNELIEYLRDEDIQNYARERALEGTLTNKPRYSLGDIFYENLARAITITPETNPTVARNKLILKGALPILRVPTNHINMWLDYTPLGLHRAKAQLRSGDNISDTMKSDERLEKWAKVAFGMGVYAILLKSIFDFEEDGELVLQDDAWIQFSASGWQKNKGYLYDKANSKDWKEYSFRVKSLFKEGYTSWNSYKDMPLGFIFSSLGYMSDALRYNQRQDRPKLTNIENFLAFYFQKGVMSPVFMVREQNYMQGLDKLLDVASEKGTIDAAMGFAMKPITAMMPNLYKQVGKTWATLDGHQARRGVRYKDDFALALKDDIFKNIPFMDQYITDKQFDQLGYPIDAKFEIPYTPESLFGYAIKIAESQNVPEKRGWELVYKYPEVTLGDYITVRSMKIGGKDVEITREDRLWFEKQAADMFRQRLDGSYGRLNGLGPDMLQKRINNIKDEVRKATRAKLYRRKKSNIQ